MRDECSHLFHREPHGVYDAALEQHAVDLRVNNVFVVDFEAHASILSHVESAINPPQR